jgi:predicted PurR-regulated permease PerM
VRVRIATRTILLAVGLCLLGLLVLVVFARSRRVVGWLLAAMTIAGLLEPAVDALARVVRRGVALAAVALLTLGLIGAVGYRVVNDVVSQTRALQRSAPREVARLEDSERFGDVVREYRLVERTQRVVDEIPKRLLGPTPAAALRSVTARAASGLVVTVLSLFVLSRRRRIVEAGLRQIRDDTRRDRVGTVIERGYARGFGYLRGTIALAALGGVLAYWLAVGAGVPGAAPLGIWAALWGLVPVVGAFLGFAPVIVLAAIGSPVTGALVGLAVVVQQGAEAYVRGRWLEPRTIRLGPFVTALALYAGLEAGGVFGALVLLAVATLTAALIDEATS